MRKWKTEKVWFFHFAKLSAPFIMFLLWWKFQSIVALAFIENIIGLLIELRFFIEYRPLQSWFWSAWIWLVRQRSNHRQATSFSSSSSSSSSSLPSKKMLFIRWRLVWWINLLPADYRYRLCCCPAAAAPAARCCCCCCCCCWCPCCCCCHSYCPVSSLTCVPSEQG